MRHPLHDYEGGAGYFITFVTAKRAPILGKIADGLFVPSRAGDILHDTWLSLHARFPSLTLDALQLMPDHVHCIIILLRNMHVQQAEQEDYGLSDVIHVLKGTSARRINELRGTPGQPVWQSRFMDRVIRSEKELEKFRAYIVNNPFRQHLDTK
jgi:putative transposase